jgi:phosphatidylglycerophosphatase A
VSGTGQWERLHQPRPSLWSAFASPATAIATVFGAGFFPIWPGTFGSVLALPLVYVIEPLDPAAKVAIYLVLFLVGVWAAQGAGRQFGEADHSAIVCDELWSMAVVWECTPGGFRWMATSFIAFRLFDAVKPWPISAIDRGMKNGLGVMLDDSLAALASILAVWALHAAIVAVGWG